MLATLLQIIIALVIIGLIYWAYTQLIGLVPMPPPIATVLHVVVIVILVLALIYYAILPLFGLLFGMLGSGGLHLSR